VQRLGVFGILAKSRYAKKKIKNLTIIPATSWFLGQRKKNRTFFVVLLRWVGVLTPLFDLRES
jgi:hypothetical protein